MIQYFAELLDGFAFTHYGWVQAYGSRCVRPPILYGDVARPKPMTVEWITYAQSLTDKPVKGMLTGPVTMLARSFVRQDQPLYETADQLALAIRDEIADLEAAGIAIIQVDEPAIRELLPLREDGREEYLGWAVDAFRLATGGAQAGDADPHPHDATPSRPSVVDAIERLDCRRHRDRGDPLDRAGCSRPSRSAALTHGVGPGVYESRSARIPDIDELDELLTEAAKSVDARTGCGPTRTADSRPATTGSSSRRCATWWRPRRVSAGGPRRKNPRPDFAGVFGVTASTVAPNVRSVVQTCRHVSMVTAAAYAVTSSEGAFEKTAIERRELGPLDILIEIKYAGICHSDIHTARNEWGEHALSGRARARDRRHRRPRSVPT